MSPEPSLTAAALERVNLIIGSVSVVFTTLFVVVGLIIYGSLRELRNETKELVGVTVSGRLQDQDFISSRAGPLIEAAVKREFDARLSLLTSRYEELNTKFEISQLADLSDVITRKDSFSNEERDDALRQLLALGDLKGLDKNPQFVGSLEKIIDAFFAAGLRHQVTEIEKKFDYILLSNFRVVLTLLQHYGLLTLGASVPDKEDVGKLLLYIDASERFKLYYAALTYRIAIAVKLDDDWENRAGMLLDDVDSLEASHRQAFYENWIRNTTATGFSKNPEARHERMASIYRKVAAKFPSRFGGSGPPSTSSSPVVLDTPLS